jgi:hypothetical protein
LGNRAVPHYYFHLRDAFEVLHDPDGSEHADPAAAMAYAALQVRGLVSQEVRETGDIRLARHIDVEDQAGLPIDSLAFSDALAIRNR